MATRSPTYENRRRAIGSYRSQLPLPCVSTKSIYTWQKQFSRPAKGIQEVDARADEIRRLKRDLARVTEERDILKKATAYFARESR